MRPPTSVFVVDDHRLFRAGVRSEVAGRLRIVGEAGDVDAAVEGILATKPEVVLLDVHLPGGGGRAVIERVHETLPDMPFLAISVSDAAEDVVATVRAGARGYVTKTVDPEELIEAVHRVAGGDAAFSPRLAGFVLDAFSSVPAGAAAPELATLTKREREVLRLIARGCTYREAADRLVVSPRTVESHVSAVLRKLQLGNRHELSRWAAERHLD